MTRQKRWIEIVPIVLLVALWTFFYYRVLFGGHTFILGDSSRFFYPLWKWGGDIWNRGLIPLWNPDAGFGTPYLADPQMAVWCPPLHLAYFFLGPVAAFNACILFHHLFALLGFYFFAKGRSFSNPTALLGAFFFGFSIHAVSLSSDPSILFSFSWIPWVFLSADLLFGGSRWGIAVLSVSLAMQMASGYPLLTYLTLMVLGVERVLEWFSRKKAEARKNGGEKPVQLLAVLGLAIAFNLVWILPFSEFKDLSNFSQRLDLRQGMPPETLLTWFNPFRLGHPLHSSGDLLFELSSFFMGLPALCLVLWSVLTRKIGLVPILLTGMWILLSLGETAKLGDWAQHFIPFYSWVTRSGYWMPLVVFAMARLAMAAMEEKMKRDESERGPDTVWQVVVVFVFGLALIWGVPIDLWTFWVSFLLSLAFGLKVETPLIRWTFLAGATLFSVFPVIQSVNFTMDRSYYETPPDFLAKMNQNGRIYESYPMVERSKVLSGKGVQDTYEKFKGQFVSNLPLAFGKEECFFYSSLFLSDYFRWCFSSMCFSEKISRNVLDYLAVQYVLGPHHFKDFRWILKEDQPLSVSQNLTPLPKWFSVEAALLETDWVGDLRKMEGPNFDFSKICFEEDAAKAGRFSLRRVQELERTPNSVTLQALGHGEALLVSSETAYPGWKAEVNGSLRNLERINHGFRGVRLGDKEEQAKLFYRPTSFRFGLFSSLLVCGLWVGMILRVRLKPKYA